MADRERRRPSGRVASGARSALEELRARRTGGKRDDRFELKEEEAVYDVVDDAKYEEIVNERRKTAGASESRERTEEEEEETRRRIRKARGVGGPRARKRGVGPDRRSVRRAASARAACCPTCFPVVPVDDFRPLDVVLIVFFFRVCSWVCGGSQRPRVWRYGRGG